MSNVPDSLPAGKEKHNTMKWYISALLTIF